MSDLERSWYAMREFVLAFNNHLLPAYLSAEAIKALGTLPEDERREIVRVLLGHAMDSRNRGMVIVKAAKPKRAPKWLKAWAEKIGGNDEVGVAAWKAIDDGLSSYPPATIATLGGES